MDAPKRAPHSHPGGVWGSGRNRRHFNAPIARVMFALEIILAEFGALQFATR